ncbi:hypothetical protein LCGC14_2978900, partial [marine sediment metagenome]
MKEQLISFETAKLASEKGFFKKPSEHGRVIGAWYNEKGQIGFGSDFEDARGIDHPPAIAGAYFAGKLGVAEYLSKNKIQAAALVLREIRPEYAIPVGVWQVREGIRSAMNQQPFITS